jgi:hypothetical protein
MGAPQPPRGAGIVSSSTKTPSGARVGLAPGQPHAHEHAQSSASGTAARSGTGSLPGASSAHSAVTSPVEERKRTSAAAIPAARRAPASVLTRPAP